MENYIVINGKKAELTKEQLKALGIVTEKENPFVRCNYGDCYYSIGLNGDLECIEETHDDVDLNLYNVANYCADVNIMQQRAWHETLNRLLWRYSMEHNGDEIDWSTTVTQRKYNILRNDIEHKFEVSWIYNTRHIGTVYFICQSVAESAIKEIIEPFMKAHPDFVW